MSNIMEESEKLRQALTPLIRNIVNEETRSCLRTYKAKVMSTPSGGKMGVQLVGEKATRYFPYSSAISDIAIGQMVLILTTYNSWLNAIVWQKIDFSNDYVSQIGYTGYLDDDNQLYAVLTYRRIEAKKGLLSVSLKFPENFSNETFTFISIAKLEQIFSISIETNYRASGYWLADKVTDMLYGYAPVMIFEGNAITIGRVYDTNGSVGGWALNNFAGMKFIARDIEIIEN